LAGLMGSPGCAASHATKYGVLGLTKSAALESAPRGIRVDAVCLGTIQTPMVADMITKRELAVGDAEAGQPIGRLGRGVEIAAAVLWLCSRASLVVGVALPVDGGYTALSQAGEVARGDGIGIAASACLRALARRSNHRARPCLGAVVGRRKLGSGLYRCWPRL
jgi:Enoyl-(Acyl carrier protein) reductase